MSKCNYFFEQTCHLHHLRTMLMADVTCVNITLSLLQIFSHLMLKCHPVDTLYFLSSFVTLWVVPSEQSVNIPIRAAMSNVRTGVMASWVELATRILVQIQHWWYQSATVTLMIPKCYLQRSDLKVAPCYVATDSFYTYRRILQPTHCSQYVTSCDILYACRKASAAIKITKTYCTYVCHSVCWAEAVPWLQCSISAKSIDPSTILKIQGLPNSNPSKWSHPGLMCIQSIL